MQFANAEEEESYSTGYLCESLSQSLHHRVAEGACTACCIIAVVMLYRIDFFSKGKYEAILSSYRYPDDVRIGGVKNISLSG